VTGTGFARVLVLVPVAGAVTTCLVDAGTGSAVTPVSTPDAGGRLLTSHPAPRSACWVSVPPDRPTRKRGPPPSAGGSDQTALRSATLTCAGRTHKPAGTTSTTPP
jgi:hypothetical protein